MSGDSERDQKALSLGKSIRGSPFCTSQISRYEGPKMEIFGAPSSPQKKSLEFIKRERSHADELGASTACLAVSLHDGESIPLGIMLGGEWKSSPTAPCRPFPQERHASPMKMERTDILTSKGKLTSLSPRRAAKKHRDASPSKQCRRHESPRRRRSMCTDEQNTGSPRRVASEAKVQVRSSSEQEKEAILSALICKRRCEVSLTTGHVSPDRSSRRRRKSPKNRVESDRRPHADSQKSDEARKHHRTREKARYEHILAAEQMGDRVLGIRFRTKAW